MANIKSKKEINARREARGARETVMMYRYFIVTGLMILGIMSVNFLRGGLLGYQTLKYGLTPAIIVFALLTFFAVWFYTYTRKKGKDESTRVLTSTMLLVSSLVSLAHVASYKIDMGGEYANVRIIAIVAIAVLYFIYNIYETAFFVASAQLALGLIAISFCSDIAHSYSSKIIVAVAAILVAVVGGIVAFKLISARRGDSDGQVKLYIMSAIDIAAVLLSLFVTGISTYATFTLIAAYLVIAVISTIEMM